MCSICGLINFKRDIDEKISKVEKMGRVLKHRGLDDSGVFEFEFGAFAHNRLSVMDPDNGAQPMSVVYKGKKYTICY